MSYGEGAIFSLLIAVIFQLHRMNEYLREANRKLGDRGEGIRKQ